jgi:hypothetical protein
MQAKVLWRSAERSIGKVESFLEDVSVRNRCRDVFKLTALSRETCTDLLRNRSLDKGSGMALLSMGKPITRAGPSVLLCSWIAAAGADSSPAAMASVTTLFMVGMVIVRAGIRCSKQVSSVTS